MLVEAHFHWSNEEIVFFLVRRIPQLIGWSSQQLSLTYWSDNLINVCLIIAKGKSLQGTVAMLFKLYARNTLLFASFIIDYISVLTERKKGP